MTKLLGYQYKICYKKGSNNCAADALSRAPLPSATLHALTVALPTWSAALSDSYLHSSLAQQLLQALAVQSPQGHYTLDQGIIKYKQAIWLGHSRELQNQIME
jgi:hypothetical protein